MLLQCDKYEFYIQLSHINKRNWSEIGKLEIVYLVVCAGLNVKVRHEGTAWISVTGA